MQKARGLSCGTDVKNKAPANYMVGGGFVFIMLGFAKCFFATLPDKG